ncbi:acyltransferase family protein [Pendulispora brunnea]
MSLVASQLRSARDALHSGNSSRSASRRLGNKASSAPERGHVRGEPNIEPRIVALDVFRGLAIAAMLLVTNPGDSEHVYAPLKHAAWNGWTPTDLIFPSFLFIVGTSMVLSFRKRRELGEGPVALLAHVLKRCVLLYAISLLIVCIPSLLEGQRPPFETIRILGVLPRIALCYLVASPVVMFTRPRTWALLTGALLLGYWVVMTRVPVPDHGAGLLDSKEWNLAAHLDRLMLGQHLGEGGAKAWDPEGILSTVPAVGTTLLGALTGHYLHARRPAVEKTAGMFVGGALLMVLGLWWNHVFPINKSLWSSSYVLFCAGFALETLAFVHFVIDVRGHRGWARPFVIFGASPLTALILSAVGGALLWELHLHEPIYRALFASWASPRNASLAFAIAIVLLWFAVVAILHRKRLFLRL